MLCFKIKFNVLIKIKKKYLLKTKIDVWLNKNNFNL